MSVTSTGEGLASIFEAIEKLTSQEVLVGIPHGETREDGMTNAELGYLHENGSPSQNIPARPVLVPALERVQGQTADLLVKAAHAALDGNPSKVDANLKRAGMVALRSVRLYFVEGTFAPLSLATIRARANRGRSGAKKYLKQIKAGPPEAGLVRPLIDTAQFRKSTTYIIKKNGEEIYNAQS
jgi:hypothetical protein